ncbi:nuclear transport factor 2 family protein [Edaphobacter flagellatus]|uniref:nuclear transport factor 2 family protein n=1 Tax=Edaphobacter flagellatus TaxID=1933044 RepID=UPI0021B1B497|nr:nuclear transport factor 2 family protein [Edaphobacter flagellatus]
MTTISSSATSSHQTDQPDPLLQQSMEAWKRGIVQRDWSAVGKLLAEDVAYHNPASFDPYVGKSTLVTVLRTVFDIFEDFEYHRQFSSDAGYVLEFTARIGDAKLFGVDMIELNGQGLITNLMVLIRPADVVLTLSAEAANRLGVSATSTK